MLSSVVKTPIHKEVLNRCIYLALFSLLTKMFTVVMQKNLKDYCIWASSTIFYPLCKYIIKI